MSELLLLLVKIRRRKISACQFKVSDVFWGLFRTTSIERINIGYCNEKDIYKIENLTN